METKQQLIASVVIVQFAKEIGPLDVHAHILYNTIGTGEGLLFQDGKTTKITWKKADRNKRTVFYDAAGKEVTLTRGQIWIELLPTGTEVLY